MYLCPVNLSMIILFLVSVDFFVHKNWNILKTNLPFFDNLLL